MPIAAGQRPRLRGIRHRRRQPAALTSDASQATARAIARHGFSALKTSPKIGLTTGMPTQKRTKTNRRRDVVRRRLRCPRSRRRRRSTKSATPIAPASGSRIRGTPATRRSDGALEARLRPQHGRGRRTTRRARPPPPSRTATSGSGGPARPTSPWADVARAPRAHQPDRDDQTREQAASMHSRRLTMRRPRARWQRSAQDAPGRVRWPPCAPRPTRSAPSCSRARAEWVNVATLRMDQQLGRPCWSSSGTSAG